MLFKAIILFTFLLIPVFAHAQGAATSIWAVDFIKTREGQQADYLKFIEQNWAKARLYMKEKGIATSYRTASVPAAADSQWDVLLITEYVSQEGYDKREAVFEEYRKGNPQTPVNGRTAREMSEIKLSRTFNQPIHPEAFEIMLKTQNPDPELAAARIPLENYLKGHATGDPEYVKKAFHTEGKLIFVREGKYTTRTFEEYIAGMKDGKPAADEAQRKRWIESVEVSGNAGVGKIILDYPSVRFVDYMTLLKIDGSWKIVNKSFYAEPKPKK